MDIGKITDEEEGTGKEGVAEDMNTGGGWIAEEGKVERMHRARRKHGVNGGRGEGRRAGGRRQEDCRKEENVGGMAESRREKKSVSLRREGKGKEEYG